MTTLNDNGEKQRALYINTSLNTHLILFVSPLLTFSNLKQMILHEHLRCFPDFGYIEVNAFKVKRKGVYYRVVDSMLVKAAFHGVSTDWFLSVEASRKTPSAQTPVGAHVVIEPPTTLVNSSKLLMNNSHSDDLLGTTCKNEVKSQQGNSSAKKRKRRKRKCGDDGKVETVYRYEESLATESHLKSVGNETSIQNIVVDETSPASLVKKKRKVKNDNSHDTPLLDTGFSDPNRSTSEPENITNKIDGEDMQNSGLVHLNEFSSEPPETAKVFSRRKKGKRHATHEPMNLDIEVKEKEKNVSIVAVGVSEVVTVQPLSFQLEGASTNPPEHFNDGKGKDSVNVPEKTVQEPLTSTKREIEEESDPLESSKAKGIEESENTGKKKKSRKSKRSVTEKLEICNTENHQDVGNDIPTNESAEHNVDGSRHTTSTTVSDISKLDVTLAENKNRIDQDYIEVAGVEKTVQETQTEEKENTSKKKKSRKSTRSVTEKLEICNTENHRDVGNDIPTNESAEDNVDGSLRIASTTVSDISKVDFPLVENENGIEKDYIEVTGVEKTVQETHTEEKENTGKKKKSRKSTRSVTEKSDVGNDVPVNRPSEDNNDKHGSTNEVEDASEADKEKPVNEIVEVGNTAKKKKSKKGKKSSAEKAKLEEVTDIGQNNVMTRDTKSDILSSPSVVIEADDMKEVGVKSLLLSEMEKTGDDVKVETDEIIKRVCNDLTDLPKDHLERPAEEQLGEKMSEPHSTKKKAKTRNITSHVATSAADSEKAENAIQFEGGGVVKDARKIETEALHPCQVIKPKEDVEIGDDKFNESDRGEENIVKKSPGLSAEKHFVEGTSEMVPNSKQAFGDFTEDTVDNGSKLQVEVSASKNICEEFNGIPIPEVSADVSKSKKKQQKSKGRAKKLDFPSSVDTSSDGPHPPKSQKHKGTEKTPHDANEKHPTMSKQGKKSQVHNPLNSEPEDAIKKDIKVASVLDGGKSSGPSSVNSGYLLRGRKEKVKPDINVGRHKKMEVGDTVTKRKGLLVTPGAIFEDKSDASSDEEGENYGSGSSTRTPSDYVSLSDYSEGESTGVVVTSEHDSLKDGEKTANSKKSELERLNLGSVLRRSSRFKEAKVIASQMEESETQFVDFVPDSQAN